MIPFASVGSAIAPPLRLNAILAVPANTIAKPFIYFFQIYANATDRWPEDQGIRESTLFAALQFLRNLKIREFFAVANVGKQPLNQGRDVRGGLTGIA